MATWLLIWNPANFAWDDPIEGWQELARDIEKAGIAVAKWSCGVTKSIRKGDRIFMIRLGSEPRGMVASGHALTDVFEGTHWNAEKASAGKTVRRIYVVFDHILDAKHMLPYAELSQVSDTYRWSPMASGVSIPDDVAEKLETVWRKTVS